VSDGKYDGKSHRSRPLLTVFNDRDHSVMVNASRTNLSRSTHLGFYHTDALPLVFPIPEHWSPPSSSRYKQTIPQCGGHNFRSELKIALRIHDPVAFDPPLCTMTVTFLPPLFEQRQIWVLDALRRENVKAVRNHPFLWFLRALLIAVVLKFRSSVVPNLVHQSGVRRWLWGRFTPHRIMQPCTVARHPRPGLDRTLQDPPDQSPPRPRHLRPRSSKRDHLNITSFRIIH
jgi:hypothetical protein